MTVDPGSVARRVFDGFCRYNSEFSRLSQRAKANFETRDWAATQEVLNERIELYESAVGALVDDLTRTCGVDLDNRQLWSAVRRAYGQLVAEVTDAEFYKTFFSSVTRRIFRTIGVDPDVEFVALDIEPTREFRLPVRRRHYVLEQSLEDLCELLLTDFSFEVPYRDLKGAARYVAQRTAGAISDRAALFGTGYVEIELLETVFFQTNRAYLVGRILAGSSSQPLVVALANHPDGVDVDAVLMRTDELSSLFGFTRSYFLADLPAVGEAVAYLKKLMPRKPLDELYTVLGRARQGKTERFRSFYRHLNASSGSFKLADGERGMVMSVFTLPSYDVVFKVIRDRFAYPKDVTHEEVIAKYDLVFKHDRAGRLVDAQQFRRLEFPLHRFSPPVLDDLLQTCANTCRVDGDQLLIDQVYVERRLRPLNLYLRETSAGRARDAVIDYGQAIRDLAVTNIFPGDLLLKNFGVTRLGRVIFYDYDELCLVTDCRFRQLPPPSDYDDEFRQPDWFYVGANDVFPEQFIGFLGLSQELESIFREHHGELLTPGYWQRLQEKHRAGEIVQVIPYFAARRRYDMGVPA